jgi:hypothetical protein
MKALQQFAHDYAIETLVMETGGECSVPGEQETDAIRLVEQLDITSGDGQVSGRIRIYRNRHLAANPKSRLKLSSEVVPQGLEIDY